MKKVLITVSIAGAIVCLTYAQQNNEVTLAPKPAPTPYTAPHKPHTKIADLRAKNKGKASWQETIVDDDYFTANYISDAPGTKLSRRFHPDTRTWWIVMDGEMKVEIEGQQSFVAKRRSMVQVPAQTIFSMETIGDKPSLRFEVNIAKAKTLYPNDVVPPKMPGVEWIPVKMNRKPFGYSNGNRPMVTFEEFAEGVESKRVPQPRFIHDDRAVANFIYGYEKNLPPLNPNDRGHYHPECAEFWLIMSGQIRYAIEGQGVLIASEGDVVYVPKFTFHAPRFYGDGPSCRLAMNGYPNIAHLFDAVRK